MWVRDGLGLGLGIRDRVRVRVDAQSDGLLVGTEILKGRARPPTSGEGVVSDGW